MKKNLVISPLLFQTLKDSILSNENPYISGWKIIQDLNDSCKDVDESHAYKLEMLEELLEEQDKHINESAKLQKELRYQSDVINSLRQQLEVQNVKLEDVSNQRNKAVLAKVKIKDALADLNNSPMTETIYMSLEAIKEAANEINE